MQLELDALDTQLNLPDVGLVTGFNALNNQVNNPVDGLDKRVSDIEDSGGSVEITGAASTIVNDDVTANRVLISSSAGKVMASGVSVSDVTAINSAVSPSDTVTLNDTDGIVTNKSGNMMQVAASRFFVYILNKLTGAISTVLTSNLTAGRALSSTIDGKIGTSETTSQELAYLSGVTSNIQEQLNEANLNKAQTVQATRVFTSIQTNWEFMFALGGLSISVRNNNNELTQIRTDFSGTMTTIWSDNQGFGGISTISSSGAQWSKHQTSGIPRTFHMAGVAGGNEYRVQIMLRVLNDGTPSQTTRICASITMT
jgi:hypothetical protein